MEMLDSINISLILILMTAFISYQANRNREMKSKLLFIPYAIKNRGEYYRFLTHGFIHADLNHLILNMVTLFFIGPDLEYGLTYIFGPIWSPVAFVFFYLSAIVLASAPDYFRHQDHMGYSALGASGATSALLMAYVFFRPWGWFAFPPLPAIVFAIAYIWSSRYLDKRGMDNIGHNAHFWGMMYGLVFIFVSAQAFAPEFVQNFFYQLVRPTPPPFL